MADYRFYCLDHVGHIALAEWIEAGSDEEAITQAHELRRDAQMCEVWLNKRLVATINAEGEVQHISA